MKTRAALIIGCVALLGAACSESLDTTGRSSEPSGAASAAPLVPEVICVDESDGVHFGYDNQGSAVVVLDDADANVLSGADPFDEPFVPTVFAPGRVSPVFVAYPEDEFTGLTWELTGPDGTTRSATPDEDEPLCTDELLASTTPDPRTPRFELVSATLDEATDELTFELELAGVPPTSVCNRAFEAEPAVIRLEGPDPDREVFAEGTTATFTQPVIDFEQSGRGSGVTLSAVVIDRCSYEGTTFSAWPTGDFVELYNEVGVCISVEGDTPEIVPCTDDNGPPPTGGTRIRNG